MKLPRDVSGAQALRALERLGFSITRQTGSHVRLARGNRRVTAPMRRNLVAGALQSILRQAGVSLDEFVGALPELDEPPWPLARALRATAGRFAGRAAAGTAV